MFYYSLKNSEFLPSFIYGNVIKLPIINSKSDLSQSNNSDTNKLKYFDCFVGFQQIFSLATIQTSFTHVTYLLLIRRPTVEVRKRGIIPSQHTHTAKMCWNVNVYSPLCPAPGKKWTCWEIVCWSLYGLFLCLTFVIGTCARITVLIYHSVLCAVKQTIEFVGLCSSIMSLTSALRVLLIFLTIVKMFFVRNVGLLLTWVICWSVIKEECR